MQSSSTTTPSSKSCCQQSLGQKSEKFNITKFLCVFSPPPSPAPFSPHYFKEVKISALALLKMVMHARSGGRLEVMGLILGKIDGTTMVVMDVFAVPVEGTETRVNAQTEAYEYMSTYIDSSKQVSWKRGL